MKIGEEIIYCGSGMHWAEIVKTEKGYELLIESFNTPINTDNFITRKRRN